MAIHDLAVVLLVMTAVCTDVRRRRIPNALTVPYSLPIAAGVLGEILFGDLW